MGRNVLKTLIMLLITAVLGLTTAVCAYAVTVDCVVLNNDNKVIWDLRTEPTMSFMSGSYFCQDIGNDFTCDLGITNIQQTGQDLASTSGTMMDENADGQYDLLAAEVSNPYPGYYNSISVKVYNYGTSSIIMPQPVLNWLEQQIPLPDGQVVTLYDKNGDPMAEVSWRNNTGRTLYPGYRFEEVFDFHILSVTPPDPPHDLNGLTPGYWKNWKNHYTETEMAQLLAGSIAPDIEDANDIFKNYSSKPGMELSMLKAQLLAAQLTLNLTQHPGLPNPDEAYLGINSQVQWQGATVTVGQAVNQALAILSSPAMYTRDQIIDVKDLLDMINNL